MIPVLRKPVRHPPAHHPDDALLAGYAAGSLDEATGLVVATHLALCPACRDAVALFEAVGGALLDDVEPAPMASDALPALMARLDREEAGRPAPAGTAEPARLSDPVLPRPLRDYVGGDLDAVRWKRLIRGIDLYDIPVVSAGRGRIKARLMRIKGGVAVPQHTHEGTELTLVLEGGFSDGSGHYRRGDIACSDAEVDHKPVADEGADCVCVTLTDAPLRLTGPLMRLLNPFVRF
ncbi:ChrR family anti-sigma-E factor [Skermanella mucosa]|uniref:ChrR family anti-sigma-E factor n=1 Tax=Skermanella mucosa TaxID=1789672 RepID=UPI00192C27D6|nr:ChrR family anti-sigma-E factor [Skermanella mucosa]UEM21494.1 ChrR family anti-sigma-E factor [Skermanella mucosa]